MAGGREVVWGITDTLSTQAMRVVVAGHAIED